MKESFLKKGYYCVEENCLRSLTIFDKDPQGYCNFCSPDIRRKKIAHQILNKLKELE